MSKLYNFGMEDEVRDVLPIKIVGYKAEYTNTHSSYNRILIRCNICGSLKWFPRYRVEIHGHGKFCSKKCYGEYQRGKANPYAWQGGIITSKGGRKSPTRIYIHVGYGNSYRMLSRVKIEGVLKRPLKKSEIVKFRDGDTTNLDIDNLYILDNSNEAQLERRRSYRNKWYSTHRQSRRAYAREYYHAHKDKINAYYRLRRQNHKKQSLDSAPL